MWSELLKLSMIPFLISTSETSQDFYSRVPVRHDSGYASQRGSISHEGKNGSDYPTPYSEYRQSYNGSNPPPPPPPPPHMRRQVDGALDSPSSDGSGQFRIGTAPYQHEVQSSGAHQDSSPLTPTSAEGNGHEYTMTQERKVVAKPVPLRQVDDVTPKLKRRQPKVADAYRYASSKDLNIRTDFNTHSRRW